jgi:crotonobetainyl-CoA:carnitine CoA-transferase CaiB-like acyl-CoA transferase
MGHPLAKLKILDFSTLLPGPYATMLMADMGAEVLRVEAIERHDLVRALQPKHRDCSYAYLTLNRNKAAISLDLKQSDAVGIIKKLLLDYDVIIEQFRPGVMAKLGLDYTTLAAINPKLIYCSITGYGQNGCYKDRAGHDINYLALSGLASFSGTQKTGPVLSGTQIADIAGGSHHAVMAVLAAVIARHTSGEGQHIDISMTDAAFALNGMFGAGAVGADIDPQLGQTMLNGGCFYNYYKTQDDRYLSVGSLEPKFAKIFFETIGLSEWLSSVNSMNKKDQLALKELIENAIAQHPLEHWQSLFDSLDACVEPVLTVSEAAKSQLMKDRNMVIEVKSLNGKKIKQIAPVIKFSSATAPKAMSVSEPNDVYTKQLLTGINYQPEEIEQLMTNNIVK